MNNEITPPQMVAEFHKAFGHSYGEEPAIPSEQKWTMRKALIQEELNELEQACLNDDFTEACDALGDLLWVVLGGFLDFGIDGNIGNKVMAAIHESNMSKMFNSKGEAEQFILEHSVETGPVHEIHAIHGDGRVVVVRAFGEKKGKIVKSPSYKAPDFSFLKKYVEQDSKS